MFVVSYTIHTLRQMCTRLGDLGILWHKEQEPQLAVGRAIGRPVAAKEAVAHECSLGWHLLYPMVHHLT